MLKPATEKFARFQAAGRIVAAMCDVGASVPVRFVSLYGWPDADTKPDAAARNHELCEAVFAELDAHGPAPYIVAGDFNGTISRNATVAERMARAELFDVADMQVYTHQEAALTTCQAHGSRRAVRRDYVLVARSALPWIHRVSLVQGAGFDVHWPIEVEMRPPPLRVIRRLESPTPFACPEGLTQHEW
eukprot:15320986-Alexandrium_andersonii.AAC.1